MRGSRQRSSHRRSGHVASKDRMDPWPYLLDHSASEFADRSLSPTRPLRLRAFDCQHTFADPGLRRIADAPLTGAFDTGRICRALIAGAAMWLPQTPVRDAHINRGSRYMRRLRRSRPSRIRHRRFRGRHGHARSTTRSANAAGEAAGSFHGLGGAHGHVGRQHRRCAARQARTDAQSLLGIEFRGRTCASDLNDRDLRASAIAD